jgi:CRISPR-associated protein Csc2
MLTRLRNKEKIFHSQIPLYPSGKFAHILLVRETNSYVIFRTDRELNTVKVRKSLKDNTPVTRLVWFKRKQVAPERITGRGLIRNLAQQIWNNLPESNKEVLKNAFDGGKYNCEYNGTNCQSCPDCIYYGYAIGGAEEGGSEKSKVLVDSAFSLTSFEDSHEELSFNALFEYGTMTDPSTGNTRESFGTEDHVMPEVFFPSVVTIKDPTEPEFIYVLNNILRTKRYGAENTRAGSVENHVIGIVFTDGEIFSNLKFTKALTDKLIDEGIEIKHPIPREKVIEASKCIIKPLLDTESVRIFDIILEDIEEFINEFKSNISNEDKLFLIISKIIDDIAQYRKSLFDLSPTKKGKRKQ